LTSFSGRRIRERGKRDAPGAELRKKGKRKGDGSIVLSRLASVVQLQGKREGGRTSAAFQKGGSDQHRSDWHLMPGEKKKRGGKLKGVQGEGKRK